MSQFPTTNLYTLNIDLQSLKEIALPDLYTISEGSQNVSPDTDILKALPSVW